MAPPGRLRDEREADSEPLSPRGRGCLANAQRSRGGGGGGQPNSELSAFATEARSAGRRHAGQCAGPAAIDDRRGTQTVGCAPISATDGSEVSSTGADRSLCGGFSLLRGASRGRGGRRATRR